VSDAVFLALLAVVADALQDMASDMLKDFLQRLRPGRAAGRIDGAPLARAVEQAQRRVGALRQGELCHVDEAEWSASTNGPARSFQTKNNG
jgi:hypothetical protein